MSSQKLILPHTACEHLGADFVPALIDPSRAAFSRRECLKVVVIGGVAYIVGDSVDDEKAHAEPITVAAAATAFFTWAAITVGAAALGWLTRKLCDLAWEHLVERKTHVPARDSSYHEKTRFLNEMIDYPIPRDTVKPFPDYGFAIWTRDTDDFPPHFYPISTKKSEPELKREHGDMNPIELAFLQKTQNERVYPISRRYEYLKGDVITPFVKGRVRDEILQSKFTDDEGREIDPDSWQFVAHRTYRELGDDFNGYFLTNAEITNRHEMVTTRKS